MCCCACAVCALSSNGGHVCCIIVFFCAGFLLSCTQQLSVDPSTPVSKLTSYPFDRIPYVFMRFRVGFSARVSVFTGVSITAHQSFEQINNSYVRVKQSTLTETLTSRFNKRDRVFVCWLELCVCVTDVSFVPFQQL